MTRRLSELTRRASALVIASALLFTAVPAFAEPTTTTPSTGSTSTTSPAKPTTPAKRPAPKKPSTTNRKPADTSSAIGSAGVDSQTKSFRKKLASKQAELDALTAKLDELDRELALAAESYNAASDRLSSTKERVQTAEGDLNAAQQAYAFQQDVLADRARTIYQNGSVAWIEILLGSDSVTDLMQRVKFLNTVGVRDAQIAESLRGQKDLVERQIAELKTAERDAQALEFELKARKIEVMLRIQERQDMLASTQADLLKMLDSEAARRQAEESALFSQVLAGANKKGIVVTPGSPVETALAYHGVPYLWGGATPAGFDCSGLILYVYQQHGVNLPHYSGSQFLLGTKVAYNDLQPGDVVFFGSPIHHVGMYIGGGYFLHAPRTGDFVKISVLADRGDFAGARRYPWKTRTAPIKGAVKNPADALNSVPN